MDTGSFTVGKRTYTRVSKVYARKHYQTETIAICPVNLCPGYPWASEMMLGQEPYEPAWDGDDRGTFEHRVEEFRRYNCINNETGRYVAFYKVKEIENEGLPTS